jgi:hypothetical protein
MIERILKRSLTMGIMVGQIAFTYFATLLRVPEQLNVASLRGSPGCHLISRSMVVHLSA